MHALVRWTASTRPCSLCHELDCCESRLWMQALDENEPSLEFGSRVLHPVYAHPHVERAD